MNHDSKPNILIDFLAKNAWALVIVASSVVAQWSIFGIRLDNVEARIDRQGTAITELRTEVNQNKENVAALNAKVDAVNDNVLYIRSRIDNALRANN